MGTAAVQSVLEPEGLRKMMMRVTVVFVVIGLGSGHNNNDIPSYHPLGLASVVGLSYTYKLNWL